MAKIAGKDCSVDIGGSEIVGFASWSLNTNADAIDVTDFSGNGVKAFVAGCTEWNGSIEGSAGDQAADLFIGAGGLRPGATATLKLFVNATKFYTGSAIITSIVPTVGVADAVTWSVSFQGTGALTYPA